MVVLAGLVGFMIFFASAFVILVRLGVVVTVWPAASSSMSIR